MNLSNGGTIPTDHYVVRFTPPFCEIFRDVNSFSVTSEITYLQ